MSTPSPCIGDELEPSHPSIAILGGSFDPIHLGHISIAQQTAKWLGSEKVTLIPAYLSPHKTKSHAAAEHRKQMLSALAEANNLFSIDTREIEKATPSFTVDTLEAYRLEFPKHKLFFIVGMDSLLSFTRWHRWQDILKVANLVVTVRPGYSETSLSPACFSQLEKFFTPCSPTEHGDLAGNIYFYHQKPFDISSSELRTNLSRGADCSSWLAPEIIRYIKIHRLYQ